MVSREMLDLATELNSIADLIRDGEVCAAAICYIERGRESIAVSEWATVSEMSVIGMGLIKLATDVASPDLITGTDAV